MFRNVIVYHGEKVFRVPVLVTLRDGFVSFRCPRVSFVGRFSSYRLDKYRFMSRLIDKYCGVNVFFTNCLRGTEAALYASGYCAEKMLDNKKK